MITKKNITEILFLFLPFSLCWSLRLNSFAILAYGLAVLLFYVRWSSLKVLMRQWWIYPFLGLFLLHAISLLWTADLPHGQFVLEKKAALFVLPIAIGIHAQFAEKLLPKAMLSLITGCCLAIWASIIIATYQYLQTTDYEVFFYHQLGKPLDYFNALYFSFFTFLSLVFLVDLHEKKWSFLSHRKWPSILLATTFLLGILLLSSRLFLLLTVFFLVATGIRQLSNFRASSRLKFGVFFAAAVLIAGIFLSGVPQKRFQELARSEFSVLDLDQFNWDTPFNGLTLRLLFIKFTWEILDKKDAYLSGVGLGDAQKELDNTYIEHNLYHGNPSLGDKGYLGYNTHNQFMELWLQIGFFGMLCFVLLLAQAGYWGIHTNQYPLIFLIVAILAFSGIEGLLERQRGIVLITYFLSSFYTGKQ